MPSRRCGRIRPIEPGEPGPDDVVGAAVDDRRDERGQLGRVVLAVGVAERDDGGAGADRRPEPVAHGGAEAPAALVA